jgi:hypothetical protein
MASQRQIEANRRNGAKGGPKTHAGKERSRLSSLKHGLTSSTLVVLPEENEHEYHEVLRGFRDSFKPANPAEEALVVRLAQAHWRSLRSRLVETAIYGITANAQRNHARRLIENCPENLNPHEAIAVSFMTLPEEHWGMYLRYDTTISRDFFKTLEALQKLQRTRQLGARDNERQARPIAGQPEAVPLVMAAGRQAQVFDSGIGSVSQNSTSPTQTNESQVPTAAAAQGHPTPRPALSIIAEPDPCPTMVTASQSGAVPPSQANLRL